MAPRLYGTVRSTIPYIAAVLGVLVLVWAVSFGTLPPADFTFSNGSESKTVDPASVTGQPEGRIVWALFDMWGGQHDPTLLANGNILVFDNYGFNSRSQVTEFDPVTHELAWTYKGNPRDSFFSLTCSTAQRLPNGNTLMTESEPGRAIEVTQAGDTVWEYYNPHRAGESGELIATLMEVERLSPDLTAFWASPK